LQALTFDEDVKLWKVRSNRACIVQRRVPLVDLKTYINPQPLLPYFLTSNMGIAEFLPSAESEAIQKKNRICFEF